MAQLRAVLAAFCLVGALVSCCCQGSPLRPTQTKPFVDRVDRAKMQRMRSAPFREIDAYVTSIGGHKELHLGKPGPKSESVAAWALYSLLGNYTGWNQLEVHTNESYSDAEQMECAGLLEGYITGQEIWATFNNLQLRQYCAGPSADYCKRLAAFFSKQIDWMFAQAKAAEGSGEAYYWRQFKLIFTQQESLYNGYTQYVRAFPDNAGNISSDEFYLLAMYSDIDTLETVLKRPESSRPVGSGSCSAVVKVLDGYRDILFSHDTWTHFYSMLRIYKYYDFPLSLDSGAVRIPGRKVSFSSYPGFLHSNDDFYEVGSNLAVMETTIGNYNQELFDAIVPETLPYFYRVQLANRLAVNGSEWARIFALHNSGTYNNQWMVFDYSRFKRGSEPQAGAFTVLEQLPTFIHTEDMTEFLKEHRFWPSYNLPFFPETFKHGKFQSMVDKYGDFFDFHRSPRARIFARDHGKVHNVSTLFNLMRYNDFQHDELARCDCTPPYSGENGIAARSDLNPANGTYPFGALGHRMHGATDCKIASSYTIGTLFVHTISGPTNDQQPTFRWSTSGVQQPMGHPDEFNFDPIGIHWYQV